MLAQFGGVTLAFAWMATLGFGGLLTNLLADAFGVDATGSGWLYQLPGPDPRLHLLPDPADGDRLPAGPRGAAARSGARRRSTSAPPPASTGRRSAFPLLRPAFLGSALLLFANAFAAYATAAALVSQGAPITPLLIRSALTSEVVLGQANFGYALALEMVVVVAVVMGLYAWLLRADVEVAVVRAGAGSARSGGSLRWLLLLVFAAFFLLPLVALLDFSTKVPGTGRAARAHSWRALAEDPTMTRGDHHLAAPGRCSPWSAWWCCWSRR